MGRSWTLGQNVWNEKPNILQLEVGVFVMDCQPIPKPAAVSASCQLPANRVNPCSTTTVIGKKTLILKKKRWERCLRLQVFITISFEMSLTDDRAWAPSTHCNGSLHSVSWSTVFFFHIFFRIAVSFFLPFHGSEPDAYVTGGWFSKEFQKERT